MNKTKRNNNVKQLKKGRNKKLGSALILLIGLASSQSFAQFEIKKYTINSGGSTVANGNFKISSSIGQVDASNTLTGGSFTVRGGFWNKTTTTNISEIIFANSFEI